MPKILVVNNYPLSFDIEEIQNKRKPDQTIWGINYFEERGYDVVLIPQTTSTKLRRLNQFINRFFPVEIGDLGQQFKVLKQLNQADLIYDASGTQSHLLAYMRAIGLLKVPIVSIVHKGLQPSKLKNLRKPFITLYVRGVDAFICLSKNFSDSVIAYGGGKKALKIDWGPDANFYTNYPKSNRGYIVAIGMTNRDFVTLGLAASQLKFPVRIICRQWSVTEEFKNFGENVEVTVMGNDEFIDGQEFYEILANSRAIAVPLTHIGITHLAGLTSLLDAMGIGKPIIITKNPHIDIDIEAEGIGIWVELEDINGWRKALQFFEDNEDEALAMGQRARNLVINGRNSMSFANEIMDIFEEILTGNCF